MGNKSLSEPQLGSVAFWQPGFDSGTYASLLNKMTGSVLGSVVLCAIAQVTDVMVLRGTFTDNAVRQVPNTVAGLWGLLFPFRSLIISPPVPNAPERFQ